MSQQDYLFVNSGVSVEETARTLAHVLGAQLAEPMPTGQRPGAVYLTRPAADAGNTVTVEVAENDLREDPPVQGDDAVYDYYAISLTFQVTGPGRIEADDVQHETGRAFDSIVSSTQWPTVHARAGGRMYSAWSPELGRTDFPPGTVAVVDSRRQWAPYAPPAPGN